VELPVLLAEIHIRGDLHMHSTWSDGRNSVADMVMAAARLGYEYVAITDHSERAFSMRKLSADDIPKQARRELQPCEPRFANIEILHGVEVDIMPDGSLDFDDELLAGSTSCWRRYTIRAGHDDRRLTDRYPPCDAPSARQHHSRIPPIGHRPCLPGTTSSSMSCLPRPPRLAPRWKIDGAPGHLDMDGATGAAGGRRGCHNGRGQRLPSPWKPWGGRCGSASAPRRRGGSSRANVLNTRAASDVRRLVARKRGRA
jgi:DNA polymerase (family 10)